MPNPKPSTPTVDQYFDQLSQLAESTGSELYLAQVHARASTRHLENAMKTQEDLTAEIEKARVAVNERIASDQATIDTLTATVAELKSHPAAADLQPQIDSLEALIASIQPPAPVASTTSGTPTNATSGATMNLG